MWTTARRRVDLWLKISFAFAIIVGALMFRTMVAHADEDLVQRGWVNDFANVLTTNQIESLAAHLANIERTNPDAPQVVVVTYAKLGDQTISDLTINTSKAWHVGRRERDNGVVIAIAPNERKYFISVGYGLEAYIPDAKTQAIGEKMRQALIKNKTDWNGALVAGVDAVESMLPTEAYDPNNPIKKPANVKDPVRMPGHAAFWVIGFLVIGVLFLAIIVYRRNKRYEESTNYSSYGTSRSTYTTGSYSGGYSAPRHDTTVIVVPSSSPDYSSSRRSSDSDSGSSWGSSSSSRDYTPSSDGGGDGGGYSSGGGDFGGGGGGGDL